MFGRDRVLSEGSFAMVLGREGGLARLTAATVPAAYRAGLRRDALVAEVLDAVRSAGGGRVFTHGFGGEGFRVDGPLGNGLAAGGGWVVGAALGAVAGRRGERAGVCVAGSNQQVQGLVIEGHDGE